MQQTSSISEGKGIIPPRNSSIELYRIIATFAVLIVHFNGWFVGGVPERFDFSNPTLFRTGQVIIGAATVICVNMFILISGYFGIRLKLSTVIKLCIYLALIYIPFYFLYAASHGFVLKHFIGKCLVISNAGYFIQCYFMLMILSPVLNSFIEKYGKNCLKWVIVFFALEFWFGCMMHVEELGYNHGYSVIHFVLIYMIARCIRLYEQDIKRIKPHVWIYGYLLSTVAIICCYLLGIKWCWDYSNPIVVLSSVFTFLPFLYRTYYNKAINWIAGGTLAVYIIQVTSPAHDFLKAVDNHLLESYSYPMYLLLAFGVIVITFIGSMLYGKVCSYLSNFVTSRIIRRTKDFCDYA